MSSGALMVRRDDEPSRAVMVYQPTISDPNGINAEAVRALRTRIIAQHVREGRRALAVCTPAAESGCSFVATNLALSLSQVGVRTLLVDANMRVPSIGAAFQLDEGAVGLSDYLSDPRLPLDDIIRETAYPNLAIIPAGAPTANPQELLSNVRFHDLAGQLAREFDLTIFDTPPANGCTDAQRVATVAGYSLIVARKHKTFVGDVQTLARLLQADRATVIGTVLNDF